MVKPWNCALALVVLANVFAEEPAMPPTVEKDAKLVEVFADKAFFEGPVWDPVTKKLYFTSFKKDAEKKMIEQIMRLEPEGKAAVWMDKSSGINGTYLSHDGRLLGAQGSGKRVVSLKIGVDGPEDEKILSEDPNVIAPNDLCQTARGDVYFTDPDFKAKKNSSVFRIAPDGKVAKVISEMTLPNGIICSSDGKTLYVADSFEKLWRAYPIKDDGTLGDGKVFFNPETASKADPDGMSLDEQGNLYFTGRGGIWAVSAEGKALGFIAIPVFCSNCSFGGDDGKTLYMTCSNKVFSLRMTVRGHEWVRKKQE
jgi:gluconolactonase